MARRTAPASILLPALRAVLAASSRRMILGAALAALTVLAGMGLLGLSGWFIAATAIAGLQVISALTFDVFMPSAGIRLLALGRTAARYGERLITHDATLAAIAERNPGTLDDLQGISGMGAKKLEAYGADVLRVVRAG